MQIDTPSAAHLSQVISQVTARGAHLSLYEISHIISKAKVGSRRRMELDIPVTPRRHQRSNSFMP
ncbi:hypothetical protein AC629_11910 [Bradyrhizobium sp. NAS80.1]|nr:hypothetical protein AC629_11910 [Bradyrhizobium sp. NAS80.1]